ncbi:MAG: hypothetical protein J7K66_05030 [Anaerolineaceae bacterium]|nr:hypothetical protein [Anaerolineaceae bacterium]
MAKKTSIAVMIIGTLILTACNFPLISIQNEQDPNALATAVAETVQALNAQNAQAEPQNQQPENFPAGLPTLTPLPTYTQQVVEAPPTATPLPCNKAKFVSETIPDDTEFASGETFTKSWTFKNIGTCTWNTNYKLVFSTGDAMGGPASVNLPSIVVPNAQVTISVDLTAPTDPGTYTGYWKLRADDDELFAQVYVRVKTKSAFFQVTHVSYYMPHETIDMSCPGDLGIKGEITTSAAGNVTYYWINSEGEQSATKSVNFDAAGKKIVDYTMTVTGSGPHWAKLYIDNPNHQLFGPKNFTVNCTP